MTADPMLELGRKLTCDVLQPIKQTFVGKDEIIDLMGVCLVGGENLFLLGPPGTAKSALVHELARRLDGRSFDYLLTRFTEPSEIFGPFDIRKLRDGELVTNTDGMLPEADLIFLDELLNANSAILNSLLMVLNERVFRRGRETRALPAMIVVGASNRLPEDDALNALFDRFLMRVNCNNVPGERLSEVLDAGWKLGSRGNLSHAGVSTQDIRSLQRLVPTVSLDAIRAPLVTLVERLRRAGIAVSDRRAVKLQRLIAASAILCGRQRALVSDLWIFRYIWDTLEQQELIASIVADALKAGAPDSADHPRARNANAPDPESLARDFDALVERLDAPREGDSGVSIIRDRLSVLTARCQWIQSPESRDFLLKRADEIWKRLEALAPAPVVAAPQPAAGKQP